LIEELSRMGIFEEEIRKKLIKLYNNWLDHKGVYEDYRKALIALYGENIKGCPRNKIIEASRKVVPFYKDRTYVFTSQLIKKLRQENYLIIAISGSPMEIVEEYNRYLKFDEVFGTVYDFNKEGIYTGEIVFDPALHKGHVAKQYLTQNEISLKDSYGVGDTESDAKFLEIVDHPIAFNPNLNLKEIAEKNGWRIVVEKKDVIYEIKK